MQETIQSASVELDHISLRLYTLGQVRLEHRNRQEWQPITDPAWQRQSVRALLGCLLSSPGRKLSRRELITALWPDLNEETASDRLSRTLYRLRHLLEPTLGRPAASQLLRRERELLTLADQTRVWVDADAFDGVLAEASTTAHPDQSEHMLEQALSLYGGDFWPEERHALWPVARRKALQQSWMELLLKLADVRIARQAFLGAIDPLDRLLAVDPANEAVVQRLIIVLARLKRRGEALRAYHRLASVLQQIYHIVPSPETRNLYEAVRQGERMPEPSTAVHPLSQQQATGVSVVSRASLQIGRSHQSPLVGRDSELERLRRFLLAAEHNARLNLAVSKKTPASSKTLPPALDGQHRSQFMLLMGEAGIGKTRLAEELSREAQQRGWVIVWSRIYEQESNFPYRLWMEVLRSTMTQGLWQQQEVRKHPLDYFPLVALLPELRDLLPPGTLPSSTPAEQEQLRLWEATHRLLTSIGDSTPLLIVLDDLQWADHSSIELLGYLARQLHDHPIVLLGTCREPELLASHPLHNLVAHLQREHTIETLHVQPLTNAQIGVLVAHLPEKMAQQIQTQAAGNPFFAEELAHSVDAQFIGPGGDEQATSGKPTLLPATITAALDRRMSRLSRACQQLLSNAAVVGGSFEFHVMCLMEASSAGTEEGAVLDLFEEALQANVLTEEGTGTRITYHFWHPLLVSHLYNGVSAARRALLHRRAADVLQQVYQSRVAEWATTITHHLVQGGAEPQQIAHYAELAGDHAYTLSAYPEAQRYYHLALEHMEVATREERLRLAYLLERLGECTMIQGHFEVARHLYERALEERSFASPVESQHEAQLQALLWGEIGWTWRYLGDNTRSRQCCERGEHVLQEAGVTAGPAWARLRFQQGSIHWQEGSYDEARRTAQEALTLFEESLQQQKTTAGNAPPLTRLRRTLAGDPVDLGRTHRLLGAIASSAGQPTEALTHLSIALAMFEHYHRERDIAHVCCNAGYVHLKKAEFTPAQTYLHRALDLAERLGDTPLISVVFSNLGELAARCGNLAEAEAQYKQALTLIERIDDREYLSLWHAALATIYLNQGRFAEAATCLHRSLAIGRAMKNAPCIGFAMVSLGNLRIVQAMLAFDEGEGNRTRLLMRARATLQRALTLKGLDAETRTEGLLALAQVFLLLGELGPAHRQTLAVMEEAERYELVWATARCQRLIGSILAAQEQQEQAIQSFEQALHIARRTKMRLEEARILQEYGVALLHCRSITAVHQQQGLHYLREAQQILIECSAVPDIQLGERLLTSQTL